MLLVCIAPPLLVVACIWWVLTVQAVGLSDILSLGGVVMNRELEEKLEQIKLGYVKLFEEMVNQSTTEERRVEIVAEINDLSEMTRLTMVMQNATELTLD